MTGDNERHNIYERSATTVLLVDTLHRAGDFISYADLSKAAATDVQKSRGRGCMMSARRICFREYGEVWICVPTQGLKRATSADAHAITAAGLRRVHKSSRRTVEQAKKLAITELEDDEKTIVLARMSMLGMLTIMSSEKSVKKLKAPAQSKQRELDLGETLKEFGI